MSSFEKEQFNYKYFCKKSSWIFILLCSFCSLSFAQEVEEQQVQIPQDSVQPRETIDWTLQLLVPANTKVIPAPTPTSAQAHTPTHTHTPIDSLHDSSQDLDVKNTIIAPLKDLDEGANFFNLLTFSIFLLAIYALLLLASKLLPLANNWGSFGRWFKNLVDQLILIFEPITLILILSYFVLINPIFHGVIIGFLLLLGFPHFKNYFNGRILQFANRVKIGQKIKIQDQIGIVSEMDRLGLSLKTNKGKQSLGYSKLFEDGFMIMSGDDIGGYYYLVIKPEEGKEVKNLKEKVRDFLATVPYLDHNHALSMESVEDSSGVKTRIIVKEESHLNELLTLIKESGFECKISKK